MDTDIEQRIRERAHEIWIQEGRPSGRHQDHWEQARRELSAPGGEAVQSAETAAETGDAARTAGRRGEAQPSPSSTPADAAATAAEASEGQPS